jgi:ParB family chromosome partitioning protein
VPPGRRARREAASTTVPTACKPTTRLSVLLTALPGIGVWRLEVHGYYAAVELAGVARILSRATEAGYIVPARLRLEQREKKVPGRPTNRYAVPVIDLVDTRVVEAATRQVETVPNGGLKPKTGKTKTRAGESPAIADVVAFAATNGLDTVATSETRARLVDLRLELVDVGENVRADAGDLAELAASIADLGVLQPIRAIGPGPDGHYRAVWGQRRILASRIAKRTTIPALVEASADVDDVGAKRSIEQLAENLQRKDLNPIEEARALRDVLTSTGLTHEALADKLGRSRPWVSNVLGLLEAAEPVQELIQQGRLSPSHANAVRGLAPKTAAKLAKEAADHGDTAHGLEQMVQQYKRDEKWRKEREEASAKAIEERRAVVERSLATLEKKKVAKDAPIRIATWSGGEQSSQVKQLIEKAGYTDVKVVSMNAISSKPKGVACDCTAWKVEINWNGALTIVPGCTKDAHLRQKSSNDEAVRRAKGAVQAQVIERLAELAPSQVQTTSPTEAARIHVTPLFARMALWHLLSWQVADWSEKLGGKRNNPWKTIAGLTEEQLADELAKATAKAFRDAHGYHIGWEGIAEELGVSIDDGPESKDPSLLISRVAAAAGLAVPAGDEAEEQLRGRAGRRRSTTSRRRSPTSRGPTS